MNTEGKYFNYYRMVGKHKNNSLKDKFCRCIKALRKTVKLKKAVSKSGSKKVATAKESAAIAICVNSVLKTRGKTLKKFSCKNKTLITKKL